ncbi:30S ribosomal protein S17 [Candidatus Woesearchaeota archaeon]|nr:30S ribosomal protein S17 [Candidatus Woesearchaeota archaeon]
MNKEQKSKKSSKGNVRLRGRVFEGKVISDKMHKTVTVEWNRKKFVPKYERYEKRRSRVKAHNPEEINAKEGDIVKIMETRPLSKTKHFIVIEVKKTEESKENETS